jgi:hypothetical protein
VPAPRLVPKPWIGLLAAASALTAPSGAEAFSPYLVVPDPAVAEASPAYRYANMTDAEALAELDRRSILYTRLGPVAGVRAPIRLTGRLHGVYVHSSLPPEQRVVSPFEILDARLALALDDFCALLERHDIDEVVHYTMYRPNVASPDHSPPDEPHPTTVMPAAVKPTGKRPRPAMPAAAPVKGELRGLRSPGSGTVGGQAPRSLGSGKQRAAPPPPVTGIPAGARVARRDPTATGLHRTTWAAPGTRHPAGLAIDVAQLHRRDGRWISVQRDFHGRIGAKTCGDGAPVPESPDARELRVLVCESQDRGTFTYVLTPSFDAAHFDHFHMEIKPGVRWFLYH